MRFVFRSPIRVCKRSEHEQEGRQAGGSVSQGQSQSKRGSGRELIERAPEPSRGASPLQSSSELKTGDSRQGYRPRGHRRGIRWRRYR